MSTTGVSARSRAYDIVYRQEQLDARRGFLRDVLLRRIGFKLLVKAQIEGVENIPASGPGIIMMNHIAAIDPFVVVGAVTTRFIVPMSKEENYHNPLVALMARAWGAYPVRRGEVDRRALDSTIELLRQGRLVLIAPEGTRHPSLTEAKNGMTFVALHTDAVIVPTAVDGTDRFPATLKRLQRTPVQVRFGRPFRFRPSGQGRVPRAEMTAMTREAMLQLAALLPVHRRGEYRDLSPTTDYLEFVDPSAPAARVAEPLRVVG